MAGYTVGAAMDEGGQASPSLGFSTPNSEFDGPANLVSYYESGNKNIPNYRYDSGHTAGGYFQITDTNWRKYAPMVGIDPSKYPTAMSTNDYGMQRAVFDHMFAVEGIGPWARYNPRLAEAIASGRDPSMSWIPSPRALDSEQNQSNADVRYMTPEEYLSLLPPVGDDEATKTKRRNLDDSLANNDNIEQIPSLDVTPKGNKLQVADWDGRSRAQAAVDAGVDEIPVSIRGVPKDKQDDFKLLVGDGKKVSLPYTFVQVPKSSAPRSIQTPQQSVQQLAPGVVQPRQPMPNQQPGPPSPVQPSKPDFYPEIVAGVNNEITNPRSIGYRGTGVPDLATNATAGGRIAAANAGAAGQVGLGRVLSAINPVGSAQAAEPTSGGYTIGAPVSDAGTGYSVGSTPVPNTPPMGIPGLDTVAPPIANFLAAPATALAGDVGAMFQHPTSMADWAQKANAIQGQMQIPETPGGQLISNVLQSPGFLIGLALKTIFSPSQLETAAPYAKAGLDLLPVLGPMSGAMTAPARNILAKLFATPEMRAVAAINKAQPAELRRGGMPVQDIAAQMGRAQQLGIPITPHDFMVPGGPQAGLLSHAMEHSPEASGQVEKFLTERAEGTRGSSPAAPLGGAQQRLSNQAGSLLGSGSAYDAGKEIRRKTNMANTARAREGQNLAAIRKQLDTAIKTSITKTPQIRALQQAERAGTKRIADLDKEIDAQQANATGLQLGQNILRTSTRREQIRDFLKTANKDSREYLKLGVQDALTQRYAHTVPGKESVRLALDSADREKVVEAFGRAKKSAEKMMDSVDLEHRIYTRGKNTLDNLRREGMVTAREKNNMIRALASMAHYAATFVGGHSGPLYWPIRAAQYLGHVAVGGGGIAARTRGEEIARLLTDPKAKLARSGEPGLLQMPARPASIVRQSPFLSPQEWLAGSGDPLGMAAPFGGRGSGGSAANQATINSLARYSPALGYSLVAPQPQAPVQ